jgi:hypothetical protein
MIPQVLKMVASEDPVKLARFVGKTAELCAYILEGEGAQVLVRAAPMLREDEANVVATEPGSESEPVIDGESALDGVVAEFENLQEMPTE